MEELVRDLRSGWRQLGRYPGVTAVALCTLAVAIGANAAMFSVLRGLLLHPLPYPQSTALVWLAPTQLPSHRIEATGGFSPPDFLDYRAANHSFAALGAYYPNSATLVGKGAPQHVDYANVSGEFFAALGVGPALGRTIQRSDEVPSLPQVAVLGDALWRQRFGADPGVIGRSLDLDNRLFTIVGVMPPGFAYPAGTQLWAPESFHSPGSKRRNSHFLQVFARLRQPGKMALAQQDLDGIASGLAARYPDADSGQGVELMRLGDKISAPYRVSLWMMMLAALLVLGIACANVASLLLAAGAGRWREMAVRSALGASRRRLVAQLVAEGLVLAGLGGGLGWLLAAGAMPLLRSLSPPGLPQMGQIRLDGMVLGFVALATLATGLWFGLAPAWALRARAGRSLHRMAGAHASPHARLQAAAVVGEVAATAVLLVAAGLLLQNLSGLEHIDPGFQPAHVLTFRASLLYNSLDELYAKAAFFPRLGARLPQIPGVEAAGLISELPLDGPHPQVRFYLPGTPATTALHESERPLGGLARVTPGYFAAMGIPLRGRDFTDQDNASGGLVAIVSQSVAAAWFPGQDAVGRALGWGRGTQLQARIIGVAGDVRQDSLSGAPGWEIYVAEAQLPTGDMSAAVRVRGTPDALVPAVKRAIAGIDPQVAVYDVSSLAAQLGAAAAPERYRAGLLATLAILALLLAAAGLYSVLAHSVAQRQREIAVRMALGAQPQQVRRMVLRQALRWLLLGCGIGLLAAAGLIYGLRHAVAGVHAGAALIWTAVPLLLLAVGLLASYAPALHATRVEAARALRE